MALSSAGIGSGLDVNGIVTQLMNVERQPLKILQNAASSIQAKLSAYGTVKSGLSKLQDAAQALLDPSGWQAEKLTSSNTAALTGSAQAGALASAFSVQVNALAQAQSARSGTVSAGSAFGASGSLQIEVGTWSGTSFTPGSGGAINVNIDSTDNLATIANKINQANAGVRAVVVTSGGNDRLLIRGANTGEEAGFRIRAFDGANGGGTELTDGTTGLSQLAYAYNGSAFYGLTQTQAATNAQISIDGINVSSATNTISNAVPGVTLNLQSTTTSPVTVTVADDKEAIRKRITEFQSAYNSLATSLRDLTKYDPASKTAGALQGDSTAVGLQNVLRSMLGANGPGGTSFSRLSDVGLEMQRDGTLSLNSAKLDQALNKIDELNTFLSASSGDPSATGMARRINTFAQQALGVDGSVSGRNKALQEALNRNNKDQERFNTRLSQRQAALYAQFNAMDAKMGKLGSLGSFINQQISQWNKG